MSADADAMQNIRSHGFWQTARDRPLLVIIGALLIFAVALACNTFWGTAERVKTVIDIVRLEVDLDTPHPSSLIRAAPLSVDIEREAILSDQLIVDALKETTRGPATTLPLPARISPTADRLDIDSSTLAKAVSSGLNIELADQPNKLEISLLSAAIKPATNAAEIVNAIAANYADLRNQERKQQKEQVTHWADEKLASWQGINNVLKTLDSETARSNLSSAADTSQAESNTLLGLFIDATKLAQSEMLSKIQNAADQTGNQQSEYSLDDLEDDYEMLGEDLEKLERISLQANLVLIGDRSEPSNSNDAGEERALFMESLGELMSSGILDSPAAKVVLPASSFPGNPLVQWNILVPLAAALSIMIALSFAFIMSRWRGPHGQPATFGSKPSPAEGSVLSDPYWPMTPEQR